MGIYSEYLDRNLNFPDLTEERKKQLRRISDIREGRDVFVLAADLNKAQAPIAISYPDLVPVFDQLSNLTGSKVDLILETPGGSAEVVEDIVEAIRQKYDDVAVVVPGWAKSAGTIMAMAADEILLDPSSALGPIDAQLQWQGKIFSADALLEGMEKIKNEVTNTGTLNAAYIPMLQAISPGELQSAENALKFAQVLVTDWLARFKFKNWNVHSSTGQPVTGEEKKKRAEVIAAKLCNHREWLTHGRSIKLQDLRDMKLVINDFSQNSELADAIRRYHTLLQLTFSKTTIYKVFETPGSQVYQFLSPQAPAPAQAGFMEKVAVDIRCGNCDTSWRVQANLDKPQPLEPGLQPFPADNKFRCPNCGTEHDLSSARQQIELQTKKRVVV